jgi:hypothetical protein
MEAPLVDDAFATSSMREPVAAVLLESPGRLVRHGPPPTTATR